MKLAIVCFVAIATLFSGAASLQCYYCKGASCSASELQVETCYGGTRNYQGDAETMTPEDEATTESALNDETATGISGDESTSAAPGAETEGSVQPIQEETTTTTETATTPTRRPCKLWPVWNRWARGLTPMCVNGTSKGWFGRRTEFKGCVYTRYNINPCARLRLVGRVQTCSACTGDKCN